MCGRAGSGAGRMSNTKPRGAIVRVARCGRAAVRNGVRGTSGFAVGERGRGGGGVSRADAAARGATILQEAGSYRGVSQRLDQRETGVAEVSLAGMEQGEHRSVVGESDLQRDAMDTAVVAPGPSGCAAGLNLAEKH